jgi:hypothetical protein
LQSNPPDVFREPISANWTLRGEVYYETTTIAKSKGLADVEHVLLKRKPTPPLCGTPLPCSDVAVGKETGKIPCSKMLNKIVYLPSCCTITRVLAIIV